MTKYLYIFLQINKIFKRSYSLANRGRIVRIKNIQSGDDSTGMSLGVILISKDRRSLDNTMTKLQVQVTLLESNFQALMKGKGIWQ